MLVLIIVYYNALAQTNGVLSQSPQAMRNGTPLVAPFFSQRFNLSKDESIEGSPLLFEDWRFGKVILKNHEQYDYVRLNFDAVNNKFYFSQHDTSFELLNVVEEIRVKDILHATDSAYDMVFKNNIDGGNVLKPESFVEVLSDGKIVLLKQSTKRVEGQNATNGITKSVKRYVLHTNFFAIVNNQVIPVRLNSHFLDELTSDKGDQIKAFVKSKQLNLKKETDFKQAISYYNSIS